MIVSLIQDILSYNYKVYGVQGEKVTILTQFEDIYIVENQKKERYAVHRRYTSTDDILPKGAFEDTNKSAKVGKGKSKSIIKRRK